MKTRMISLALLTLCFAATVHASENAPVFPDDVVLGDLIDNNRYGMQNAHFVTSRDVIINAYDRVYATYATQGLISVDAGEFQIRGQISPGLLAENNTVVIKRGTTLFLNHEGYFQGLQTPDRRNLSEYNGDRMPIAFIMVTISRKDADSRSSHGCGIISMSSILSQDAPSIECSNGEPRLIDLTKLPIRQVQKLMSANGFELLLPEPTSP